MKIKSNDIVMIDPLSPYKATLMPDHPKNKNSNNGKSTRYGKHKVPGMIWFDYKTLSILGQPMTKQEMINKFADFSRSYPKYGSKGGGDYADMQAKRCFSCMLNEGLILRV
jgi:hypothetical protein